MEEYFAQYGEDKILNRLFAKQRGNCVEVGAFDGITGSNTYFFEKLGWRCIVIEPMSEYCSLIRARRNCEVVEIAASDAAREMEFHVAAGVETLSTLEAEPDHFARIRSLSSEGIRKISVKTARLDDILGERNVSHVDFITIDVEGHELGVLRGISFDRIKPRVVIVEANSLQASDRIKDFMRSVSYRRFLKTGCNEWYARRGDEFVTLLGSVRTYLAILWWRTKSTIKAVIDRPRHAAI